MKICLLGNSEGIHLQRWAKQFHSEGHEVHVISIKSYIIEGSDHHVVKSRFKIRALSYWSLYRNLKKILNKIDPDVLHVFYATFYGYMAAKSTFHPYIISILGSDIYRDSKKRIYKRMISIALKFADLITTDSFRIEKITKKNFKSNAKWIRLLFGVDLNLFSSENKSLDLLDKIGFPSDSKIIVSNRNHEPIYNIECLIKAIPHIIDKFSNVRLLIGGKGSLTNKLIDLTNELGIQKFVYFFGYVPYEELPHYLNLAEIYVSTSLSDSTSVSLLEAMSLDLVPVITDLLDNQEWITPYENGVLFPKGDHRALADVITSLLSKSDVLYGLKGKNREIIIEKASWSNNYQILMNSYNEIILKK
jgi:glycosyltransferase involved in cell wall biosynthesis